ncbi:tRNA uridine(34) 5-carboxymethylaminomethyl modification radical SAM/GNAT enzyme Elp3 [bacterium (Candidatus Gribaldobacteria) CG07_land_8_20_14_0_80_33_18]|uniref:tRNA uridine(34) 5-carboxymethylaminomethyl modification radical SAM/GNAT enzyme Elp3 n=1 Tax=bacterium (Candidatus Gribaldobacteria) CG07_land_8_20_14_0_80_33_18 TaxID=2014272 RepID=A0A2M6Z3W7_9BACT|nr:MAG: tRNA uridine(34) 5-carboxymethylaminomethyl modification radical SAM/GNAT enzyme Elp3 [bacterium (Candidatus Gribaldobacteria) CG10_big_fil_rev_8_21_14_0_10_33_41]PIU47104.1 MAG: tRNA uridine(34) 5-carboxymethylaminomethyl modification radical SAM/GNAT enzyme Elp3 [bacterium (Candidatus Gribaldobacteria) CG07_land_8_20_14_0_80_33_18]PJA01048.1 MAG: tRNA uridine(34) 5-carboxymethylaminomethyl modification radical SAM/GNAT enzyme Elp3 [bacterium (Candidatus Gribaldobacteria) CG_4_10_14_0_2_
METLEKIVLEMLKTRIKTRKDLDSFKRSMAKKYKILCPSNVKLLKIYHELAENKSVKSSKNIENLLRTRPIRSLSGIINVSVLTKPFPCPGKCLYCPLEKGIPKSYLKDEPAVQRAILTDFNPYLQVKTRLQSLEKIGHPIDKIELRLIGGTWSYYPKQYQCWFIKRCFQACNEWGKQKSSKLKTQNAKLQLKTKNLKNIQKKNEKTKQRIIGLSIETRPDFIDTKEIKRLRELGVTRVELGVQSIYDDVLKLNRRGHGVKAIIKATKLLKDAGFKICYQMMPNLPGSNLKKDIKMFEEIFENPDFKPDLLKIYPLALVKNAPLYKWYKKGKFKPYPNKKLIELLIEIKKRIPYYCRIQRIMRDIPSKDIIEGGAKISNLRELIQKEMKKRQLKRSEAFKCKCIRCREIRENYDPKEKIYLFRQDYEASGGKEIFLSFENKKREKLYALLRLRLPALKGTAIIREVHTYGQMLPVGEKSLSPQHQGLGKKLIKIAEGITKKKFGVKKIAVISGIGVRDYYRRKLGYRLKDTYMIKFI